MSKQTIISIGREFGSGGHVIAELLSESLGLPLYDRNILSEIEKEKGNSYEEYHAYDEKAPNPFLTRIVHGQTNSVEKIVAELQFDFLRQKAKEGESFIVLGRCAEEVLRGTKGLISIFLLADRDAKVKRVMEKFDLDENEAIAKMKRHDRKRKYYHNTYASGKWGDSRTYDLCINTSRLGLEKTAEELVNYIRFRMEHDT
ncbi:MAG: AAA family ATPase [Wujia sp.]